ncbi:hypothetical protein HDU67_003144, partial [Dinochytrium kinnereticum]
MGAIPSAVGSSLGGMIPNPFAAGHPENANVLSSNEVEDPKKEDDVKGDDQEPSSNERTSVTDEVKDDAAKESTKNEDKPSTSSFSFLSKAIPENVMGGIPSAGGSSLGGMIPNSFTASRPENANVPSSNEVEEPKKEVDVQAADDQQPTSNEQSLVTDEVKDEAAEESKKNEEKPSTSPFSFLSKAIPENVMGAIPSAVGGSLGSVIPKPFAATPPESADMPSSNEVDDPKMEDDVKGDDQQPTSNEPALVNAAEESKKNEDKPSTSPFSFLSKAIPQYVMGGIPSAVGSSLGGMIPNPFAASRPENADVPSANEVDDPMKEDDVKADDQQPTTKERASVDDQQPSWNERALVTDEVKDQAAEESTKNEDKPYTSPFSFLSKAIPENVMGAIPSAVGSSLGGMIPNPFVASRPENADVPSSNEVDDAKKEDDVKGDDQQPTSNQRASVDDEQPTSNEQSSVMDKVKDEAAEASKKNEEKPSTSPFS